MFKLCCFQWFKDSEMRANHNGMGTDDVNLISCFQWFKDTKMRANHNGITCACDLG